MSVIWKWLIRWRIEVLNAQYEHASGLVNHYTGIRDDLARRIAKVERHKLLVDDPDTLLGGIK